LIYSFSYLHL